MVPIKKIIIINIETHLTTFNCVIFYNVVSFKSLKLVLRNGIRMMTVSSEIYWITTVR